MATIQARPNIETFISRWAASEGAERANFQSFANELCDLLGVTRPAPSVSTAGQNVYAFERVVEFREPDGSKSHGRIDLYKKGCFVLEAKQSRLKGQSKEIEGQSDLFRIEAQGAGGGRRTADRAWDVLMLNAHRQAVEYARALPASDGWPPFILVCDVGRCIEVYADFTGQGKNYAQFPDRNGYQIYLEDLRKPEVRERLKLTWENPAALDPARQSAKVTRDIATRLAEVSKRLEKRDCEPEEVALFLMRCLFTMFAEDVELLPKESFKELLAKCARDKSKFVPMVEQLWRAMDKGDFAYAIEQQVRRFNGHLFKDARALPLDREEIGELLAAAKHNWREVEPAIFGTLLEQALNEKERAKFGAHYTPRAYVERLVVVTIMEPLRLEWAQVQATAERLKQEKREKDAIAVVRDFHGKLCSTRVLDPACGTGNFLYVSLELMKRLEGELLDALLDLGGEEALALEKQTVDPHQFLGLELNPRAAAIAELVIWLGYLQWHFRTKNATPNEPILRDFQNIKVMDAVLTWDDWPVPKVVTRDGKRMETFPNARRPEWPDAEFIVGNPPFIGGKDIRANLGDARAELLWSVHSHINESADLVMYWWDRAASVVAEGDGTKRFGLVTTNSITQVFSRRVVARHLEGRKPVSLLMAIPDHPWTKATEKAAAVRIAMTVGAAGRHEGVLREVVREAHLDTDQPEVELSATVGRINADLTVGVDLGAVQPLAANDGLSSRGVSLHGSGFIVTSLEAEALGLGRRRGLEKHIRPYRNGRDLTALPRGVMVIDLFGLEADEVRQRFPEVYQHLLSTVRAARDDQHQRSPTRDAKEYLERWWTHGKPREDLRTALGGLARYVATTETSKHRIFQFLEASILPDNMLVAIASDDAFYLGILCSRIHVTWTLLSGATLEDRPRYTKSVCFDPFPFPACSNDLKTRIRRVTEELDAHRKDAQARHPRLTLTQMYNVLEKLRLDEELDGDEERINADGLILILKELHDHLDDLAFKAYGWPSSLTEEELLSNLAALNGERAIQEKVGNVQWLRPDYQIPRFGSEAERARLAEARQQASEEDRVAVHQGALDLEDDLQEMKPKFPTGDELAETAAVMRVLGTSPASLSVAAICGYFSQGRQVEKRVAMTVLALARLGHLRSTDGGETFSLRRVA